MESLYYATDKPGSLGGVQSANRYLPGTRSEIKHWLSGQNAYTLHKPVRFKFQRRKIYAKGIDDLWQADLVDMRALSRYNDKFGYLLTCIDVFSKYAWVIPLVNKTGPVVADAFDGLLGLRRPNFLQTDKGSEFLCSPFQQMLQRHDIKFYTSENEDIKCAVAERFNRTLKSKMWKYFTYSKGSRYIDVLSDLVTSYNSTYHRTIKTSPDSVTSENEDDIRHVMYKPKPTPIWKYRVGDKVRISKARQVFKKGYVAGWSEEIFTISTRVDTSPVTYELKDYDGDIIKGRFYEPEIQLVRKEDDVYNVEKIVKTRKRNGKVEYFVKWAGYPDKFNSWIDAAPV